MNLTANIFESRPMPTLRGLYIYARWRIKRHPDFLFSLYPKDERSREKSIKKIATY